MPPGRLVAVNESGARIGEGHGRAKLTDHEIHLLMQLFAERDELIAQCVAVKMDRPGINRTLTKMRLSYRLIGQAMEISRRHVYYIASGMRRSQVAARWKRCT